MEDLSVQKIFNLMDKHTQDDTLQFVQINNSLSGLHEKMDEVREKVGATNGRVSKLEKWQSFMMGGIAILGIMVVPILIGFITGIVQIK